MILLVALIQSAAVAMTLYALSTACAARLGLPAWKGLAGGIILLGVLGLAQFWIVFFDATLGFPLKLLLASASLWFLVEAGRRRNSSDLELLAPCVAVVLFSTILIGWAYLGRPDLAGEVGPLRLAAQRWTFELPGDNEIPYIFAQQLRAAQITTPMIGDWLSSDRPPLQTGLYLLLNVWGTGPFGYQALASALQLLCLPAVYLLARSTGASLIWACLGMLALFVTPLVFVNGLFVWPKLLAAALLCVTAAVHFGGPKGPRSVLDGVVAGAGAALAMLSHGASAFALLAFAAAALATLRLFSWRYCAAGAAIAIGLYLPWTAYQQFYDPPGNRLLKWHLAGSMPIDDRSLSETFRDQYGKLTLKSWVDGRIQNIRTIVGDPLKTMSEVVSKKIPVSEARNRAFFSFPLGLGLFAFALWGLAGFLLLKSTQALAVATGLSLLVWALTLFEPGQTITHQGSYFPQLALMAMSVGVFSQGGMAARIGAALLTLHVFIGLVIHAAP